MCTNGINTGQFEMTIEQIDDHLKLERRWAHTLGHKAGDAGYETVSKKLHEAQALHRRRARTARRGERRAGRRCRGRRRRYGGAWYRRRRMANDLMRFSVAMPEDLLGELRSPGIATGACEEP